MNHLQIRPATREDVPYLISSWLKYYRDHSPVTRRMRHRVYFDGQHQVITRILSRKAVRVLVAHEESEPAVIFGYLVFEGEGADTTAHFAYVKEELRGQGIGRRLAAESKLDLYRCSFTHWTYMVDDLIRKFPEMTYDPYRA